MENKEELQTENILCVSRINHSKKKKTGKAQPKISEVTKQKEKNKNWNKNTELGNQKRKKVCEKNKT